MNPLTSGGQILDSYFNSLFFTPLINYSYVYWKASDPTASIVLLVLWSMAISSVIYNIVNNVSFGEHVDGEGISRRSGIGLVVIGGVWTATFGYSLVILYNETSQGEMLSFVLILVSLLFATLVLTSAGLSIVFPFYDPVDDEHN